MEERSERFSNDDLGRDAFLGLQRTRLQQLAERLPWYFTQLPQTPLAIRMVEDYRQSNTPGGLLPATGTGWQPPRPVLTLTPARLNDLPRYRLAALAFHEALPGHHLQISLAQENEQLPPFRPHSAQPRPSPKAGRCTPKNWPAKWASTRVHRKNTVRLVQELWRAVRLVLDTGLHAKGWSREQALQYQLDNTPFSATDTNAMISRYLVLPGQAVALQHGRSNAYGRSAAPWKTASAAALIWPVFILPCSAAGSMPLDVLEEADETLGRATALR